MPIIAIFIGEEVSSLEKQKVRCAHPRAKAERPGSLCGHETELVCWHCHTPRCVDHLIRIQGELLCLAAVRIKLGLTKTDDADPVRRTSL
jgi:hypothetical protein